MATNGLWINGVQVRSVALRDGDVLCMDSVAVVYRLVVSDTSSATRRLQRIAAAWAIVAAGVLAWILLAR